MFLKVQFRFLIHILKLKDCQVDPTRFAPLFPSGDKGFRGLKGKAHIFFSWLFHWNSDQKWWFHVLLWSKNLKPVVVSLKPVFFLVELRPKAFNSTKKTRVSMNTTTGFQVLISKVTREYHHFFVRVSLKTVNKNKIKHERVSYETIH